MRQNINRKNSGNEHMDCKQATELELDKRKGEHKNEFRYMR
jgi:hypothetical protein